MTGTFSKLLKITITLLLLSACKGGVDVNSNYSPPLTDTNPSGVVITFPEDLPFYSNQSDLEIRGLCNQNATIVLNGDFDDSVRCSSSGTFSFNVSQADDGTYNYRVAQQNGSFTTTPVTLTWIKKSTVSIPALTNPNTNPFSSASTSLEVQGSCETGARIEVEVDSSVQSTNCINSSFSIEIFKFADGDFTVEVRQIDQAGNQAQTSFVWTKANIAVNPNDPQIVVTRNQIFNITGGTPPYATVFTDNQSGGSFDETTRTYTAGSISGVVDILEITDALNFTVIVNITVIPDVPDRFEFPLPNGNFQSQIIGRGFANPIVAQVVDRFGNAVPNYSVIFKETSGDIDLTSSKRVLTNALGFASVTLDQGYTSVRSTLVATPLSGPLPDVGSTGRTSLSYQVNSTNNNTGNLGLDYALGSGSENTVVEDFDNDGLEDVVILNKGERSLSVFLGQTSGIFQRVNKVLNLCSGPSSIGSGDFNADSNVDIVLSCAGDPNYYFIQGQGNGSFINPVATPISGGESTVVDLAVGDVNGDSILDLAMLSAGTSRLAIRIGNNDGTFQAPTLYDTSASPSKVSIADVDRMNGDDVLVMNSASLNETVAIFFNNGTGVLALPDTGSTYFIPEAPADLYVVDLNNDTYPDFVTASNTLNEISVFVNSGDGSYDLPNSTTVGSSPTSIHSFDFNGDTNLDLFISNIGDDTVTVLTGNGNGSFGSGGTFDTKISPIFLESLDANDDGNEDLIIVANGSSELQVLLGDSQGNLGLETTTDAGPKAMLGFDFNQDGIRDKAVLSENANTLKIYAGNNKGRYTLFETLNIGLVTPSALITDDFNSDGFADLALTNSGTGSLVVYTNQAGTTFGSPQIIPGLSQPMALTSGDLNSDGFSDIVVTFSGSNQFSVYLNNGSGGFTSRQDRSTGAQPLDVKLADVNLDRVLDILMVNGSETTNNLSVYYGNGDGSFSNPSGFDAETAPNALVVGYFNTDAFVDVAVLNNTSATVSVFLGLSGGSFQTANNFFVGATPQDLVMADINGDNFQDLVVANGLNQRVTVLFGSLSGNYSITEEINVGINSVYLDIDDVNNDGAVDLSVIDGTNSAFKTLLGH